VSKERGDNLQKQQQLPQIDPNLTFPRLIPKEGINSLSHHSNHHSMEIYISFSDRIEDQANVGKKKKRQRKTPSLFSFSHVAPSNTTGCPQQKDRSALIVSAESHELQHLRLNSKNILYRPNSKC